MASKIIHKVAYYSQFDHVEREEWKSRACSIACLKMALDFLKEGEDSSVDALIDEAVLVKGWTPHGWTHDSLTLVAHNHGVPAYREEFRSLHVDVSTGTFSPSISAEELLRYGVQKLVSHLENGGLTIISTHRNWQTSESFHTVIFIGFEKEGDRITGFYYHDPDTEGGRKENQFITLADFLSGWRKMAVFLGKV